jgi:hypothetical protein
LLQGPNKLNFYGHAASAKAAATEAAVVWVPPAAPAVPGAKAKAGAPVSFPTRMLPALAALAAAAWGVSVSAVAAELDMAATGAATGWLPDAHFAAQWGLEGRCDIERLHEAPTRARLLAATQPLIFRGEGNGALRAAVSREALLRRCGAQSVVLGTAEELATEGRGRLTATLAEFVGGVMRGADPQRGRQSYAFETGLLERCERQGQPPGRGEPSASLYRKPGALASADSFQAPLVFAVGASGSGIPFHRHANAYNELLVGAKRWSFLSPGDRDIDEGVRRRGHLAWLREVLPGLPPGDVLECTQQPGDVIFVPEGWWHATLNLGEVLAVAMLEWSPFGLDGAPLAPRSPSMS